jgi:basic amino acid/polyamine antiporter, APA family
MSSNVGEAADMRSAGKSMFTRTASGVVRQIPLKDMALFGFLATGGIYSFIYMFPSPLALSPGISIPLTLLFTFLFSILVWMVYAAMGSAMPREGGDYVYDSRTIHPVVGFSTAWAIQLCGWLFVVSGGIYALNVLGLAPILEVFGFTGAASWLLTPTGGFVVAIVFIATAWTLSVYGMGVYRRFQRWVLIPLIAIGAGTTIIVLLFNLNTDFASAFNAFGAGTGISWESVHNAAREAGFSPVPFSLKSTVIWVAVFGGFIPYTVFPAQGILGEVKDASNLNRLFLAFFIPGAIAAFVLMILPWMLLQSITGNNFLNEFAAAYVGGTISPAYVPNINTFVTMLTHGNRFITVLVSLGFIAGGYGFSSTVFINAPRIMLAMSIDGLLPGFLGRVSKRFFTPVGAITVWSIASLGVMAWFSYSPGSTLSFLSAGLVLATLIFGITAFGAALFPYTAPGIYSSSPVARFKLGSVPLITIIGALTAVLSVLCVYWAVTEPAIGVTSLGARVAAVSLFVSGVVIYLVWKQVRAHRGIDISLAMKEVPPE